MSDFIYPSVYLRHVFLFACFFWSYIVDRCFAQEHFISDTLRLWLSTFCMAVFFYKHCVVLLSSTVQWPAHQSKAVCTPGRESHSEGLEKGHQTGRGNAQVDFKKKKKNACDCKSEWSLRESFTPLCHIGVKVTDFKHFNLMQSAAHLSHLICTCVGSVCVGVCQYIPEGSSIIIRAGSNNTQASCWVIPLSPFYRVCTCSCCYSESIYQLNRQYLLSSSLFLSRSDRWALCQANLLEAVIVQQNSIHTLIPPLQLWHKKIFLDSL